MKTLIWVIIILLVLVGVGFYVGKFKDAVTPVTTIPNNAGSVATTTNTNADNSASSTSNSMIRVTTPTSNSLVKSPLIVTGEARGNWYFEASFPVRVTDANGKELGVIPAQAQGEWMTTNFVPFVATVKFSTSTTETGYLILEKDNPSGLPQNAAEIKIPIRFR